MILLTYQQDSDTSGPRRALQFATGGPVYSWNPRAVDVQPILQIDERGRAARERLVEYNFGATGVPGTAYMEWRR